MHCKYYTDYCIVLNVCIQHLHTEKTHSEPTAKVKMLTVKNTLNEKHVSIVSLLQHQVHHSVKYVLVSENVLKSAQDMQTVSDKLV